MREHQTLYNRNALSIRSVPYLLALLAANAFAQTAPTNFTANKEIFLATKTPLGDAVVSISSGTVITNYEVQGDKVKVGQGPFTALVALADVQPAPTPAPAISPENTPPTEPPTIAAPAPDELATTIMAAPFILPGWVLPAAAGALVAYAFFATVALLSTRRRRGKSSSTSPRPTADDTPVITIPDKARAKPAVIADGGRAIACPLCGKNIPLEKISKGRNRCPSCNGAFVGE